MNTLIYSAQSLQVDKTAVTKSIRRWTVFFIVMLILSGITAFPVQTELHFLLRYESFFPEFLRRWLFRVNDAVDALAANEPYLLYGYDWLAFAHIVIALFFYGVWKNPVQNLWVVHTGMIACLGIIPLAFICGSIRGIPFFWTMVDCSFALFGFLPLYRIHSLVKKMVKAEVA
jgi:hypothetical protein